MLRGTRRAAIAPTLVFPKAKDMSVDLATVKRVARLARIAVSDEEAER